MLKNSKIMKKIAFTLLLLFFTVSITSKLTAQNLRFGLKASPSLAWLKPDAEGYQSEGLRMGFSYGLLTEFLLAEQYSFATGAHITYLGGKLSYPAQQTTNGNTYVGEKERTYRLQNIEIPLSLKMKTREIGYNTYFAIFGFGNSINLRARADDEFSSQDSNFSTNDQDIKSEIPFLRVSLILGLGVEHSLGGNTALIGGLTFNNGFTNVLKGENPVNNRKQNAKANFIELSFGVLF